MTDERKQELRQLFEEAMQSVIIEAPDRYEPISVEKYKECAKAFRESYRPDLSSILLYYRPNIQEETVKSKLFNFVKEELADYIQQNESAEPPWTHSICPAKIAIRGTNILPCPLDSLLEKLLEISIASGTDKAISALDKCTRETVGVFQKIVLLQGPIYPFWLESKTEDSKEIRVSDGIRLVSFPLNPSELPPYLFDQRFSPILNSAGPSVFRQKTVLIIDHTVSPLFSKPSSENENQFEIKTKNAEFPNFDVEKFCQAFSLLSNYPVEPVLQWSYVDQDELFNPQSVTTEVLNLRTPKENSTITRIDEARVEKIKDRYKKLTNLSSDVEEKLHIPVDRWIKSKAEDNPVDKIIDLGIAFESLYVPAKVPGKSRKIVYNLKKNASRYLGTNKDNQEKLKKKFKVIYDCRCDAAHEGRLKEKIEIEKDKHVPQSEFITEAQDLCRRSIMKILEDGEFPD